MDILEQYKSQHPEAFRPQAAPSAGAEEYGFIIKLVLRMPGGAVRSPKQANKILLGAAGAVFVTALILFLWRGGSGLPPDAEIRRDTPTAGVRAGAGTQLP